MPHFDRFDICEAYWLAMPGRFCTSSFKPRPSLKGPADLEDNALEIYAGVLARTGQLERPAHPVANTRSDGESLYLMWAGDGFSPVQVYVWADSLDDAFDALTEWLDDNAPGCLVSHEVAQAALEEWQEENDVYPDADGDFADDSVFEQVEQANGWTLIGHTSLKTGSHIHSHEWGGHDVTDEVEHDTVLIAGTETAQAHWLAEDRSEAIAECERTLRTYDETAARVARLAGPDSSGAQRAVWYSEREHICRMRHDALVHLLCQGVQP